MQNIKFPYRNNKGFTLMELICGICIGSILIGVCISMLNFSVKAASIGEDMDELLYNSRFAIEYIKNEVNSGDLIISSDKIVDLNTKYPNNIGFVIMDYETNSSLSEKYVFITYHIKENKLFRISRRLLSDKYPNAQVLSVSNEICEYAIDFDNTYVDWENKLLYLNISMGNGDSIDVYKSTVYLDFPVDY